MLLSTESLTYIWCSVVQGDTALTWAALYDNAPVVKAILKTGADVNSVDNTVLY
jgi:ankyrin repeat protein